VTGGFEMEDEVEKQIDSDLARKRLFFRCMIACFVLAIGDHIYGVTVGDYSNVVLSGNIGFPVPPEPYAALFFLFLILAFVFFVLYARY
jgi:hypothetical protein